MTIPPEAIQDGAKNLLAHGTIVSELRQAKGGWVAAGPVIQEEFLDMSRAVLTAALPALERQICEQVAQEILDNHRLYECHEEDPQSDNHPRACVWEIAQSAAEDVLGREQA